MGFFDFFRRSPKVSKEALLPLVHRTTALEAMRAACAAERGEDPGWAVERLNDVFSIALATPTANGLAPVSLADTRLGRADAFREAIKNVAPTVAEAEFGNGLVLWHTSNQTAGAATFMAGSLPVPLEKPFVLMLPFADLAVMTSANDLEGLEHMLSLAEAAYEAHERSGQARSLDAITFDEKERGLLWLPPEDHPLRARFVELAARARRREAQDRWGDDLGCGLAPLGVERGGLVAGWRRGADVIIPDSCDRVVLFDTDDAPNRTLEVDFKLLRQVLPEYFVETPRESWRVRADLFPTHRECAFLAARQAASVMATEVPAQTLLDAWDAGVPMAVGPGTLPVDGAPPLHVRVEHPDGRFGQVALDDLLERRKALAAGDELRFRALVRAQLFEALSSSMGRLTTDAEPQSVARPNQPAADFVPDEVLVDQMLAAQAFVVPSPPDEDDDEETSIDGTRLFIAVLPPQGQDASTPEQRTEPFAEGLGLFLVLDIGDSMVPLDRLALPTELNETFWRTARLNLRATSVQPFSPTQTPGVYRANWKDGYDLSRALLLPELALACSVKGRPLIFAPTADTVWVTGSDDLDGQHAVLDTIESRLTQEVSRGELYFGSPWVATHEGVRKWTVPPEHPLRARMEAVDAQLAKHRGSAKS